MKFSGTFSKMILTVAAIMFCGTIAFGQTPLNPNDVSISSNLQLWLNAGAGVTTQDNSGLGAPASASDVMLWADQSGNGNNLSQSTVGMMPELVTNAMNGQPVVRFEGTGVGSTVQEYLAGTFSTPLDINTGTLFYVASLNGPTPSSLRYAMLEMTPTGETYGYLHGLGGDDVFFEHHGEGGATGDKMQKNSVQINADTPFLVTENYQKSGPSSKIYMNQEQQYLSWKSDRNYTTLLQDVNEIRVGARFNGEFDWFLGGDVAEIIFYDRQLTYPEQQGVEAYLSDKYGLPTPSAAVEDPGSWPSQYANTIMADSPLAYYRMDEGYGEVLHDVSGNNLNAVLQGSGTPTYGVARPIGQDANNTAITLAGDAFFLAIDPDSVLDFGTNEDFSVEIWMKTDALPTSSSQKIALFNKGDGSGSFWSRIQEGGVARVLLDYGATANSAQDTVNICDDEWHQVVLVADRDSALQLYIDGVLAVEDTEMLTGSISSDLPLLIGALGINSQEFIGSLDEMAIFGEALTQAQIQAHYNAASVPEPSAIVLLLCGGLAGLFYLRRK